MELLVLSDWQPKSIGIDTIQEVVFEPGVSENDIIKKISPPYQIENKFVGDFSGIEIYKLLKILRKQDIVKPISESTEKPVLDFVTQEEHDFVFDWNILLDTILTNMQDKWILLIKKQQLQKKLGICRYLPKTKVMISLRVWR